MFSSSTSLAAMPCPDLQWLLERNRALGYVGPHVRDGGQAIVAVQHEGSR